jgi:hypothetical protein
MHWHGEKHIQITRGTFFKRFHDLAMAKQHLRKFLN